MWTNDVSRYRQLYGNKEVIWHDVAVDPIEGTTPTVTSGPEAIYAIAVGTKSSMFHTEYFYMNKIDDELRDYEPGYPSNKPDVLKQIKEITEQREKLKREMLSKQMISLFMKSSLLSSISWVT